MIPLVFFIFKDISIYLVKNILFTLFFIDKTDLRLNCIKNITDRLENINIVYIKVFQTLCLEKNLLNENEKNFLIKYTDKVPFNINEIDYEYLDMICNKYDITLDSRLPCNSGIMAVIFKGKIKNRDFENVVLKLKKNGIDEKYINAYNNLMKLAEYSNYIPFLNNFKLDRVLKDCRENTLLQGNFMNECENLNKFYNIIDNKSEFRIPRCFPEMTKNFNNIIVMEDITGLTINDILPMSDNIKYNFTKLLLKFGICSQLHYGILNGDFHAGNTFFYLNYDENNNPIYKIGIIDFGLSFQLSKKNQERDYKFLYNMFTLHDFSEKEEIIIEWLDNKNDWFKLDKNIRENSLKKFENNILYCKNMDLDFFYSLAKIFNKNKMYFSKEFNNMVLSLTCCRSTASILSDDLVNITKEIMTNFKNIENIYKID